MCAHKTVLDEDEDEDFEGYTYGPLEALEIALSDRQVRCQLSALQNRLRAKLVFMGVEYTIDVFYDATREEVRFQAVLPLVQKPLTSTHCLNIVNEYAQNPRTGGRVTYLEDTTSFMWQMMWLLGGAAGVSVAQAEVYLDKMIAEVHRLRNVVFHDAYDLTATTPEMLTLLLIEAAGNA
jgi:hypothetical protein